MSILTEFQQLAAERERVARKLQPAKDRAVVKWFMRRTNPEPDFYVWRDVGDLFPEIAE
jgi:hypothetical protein